MKDSPLHSVYIRPPAGIRKRLLALFKRLCKKYENQYLDERNWEPHITVMNFRVRPKDSKKFVERIERILKVAKPFPIKFTGIDLSPQRGDYIFLNLDKASREKILGLRKVMWKATQSLRDKRLSADHRRMWKDFTEAEKERVRRTSSEYEYIPHVSIVKFTTEEAKDALKSLNRGMFHGTKFDASEFVISKGESRTYKTDTFRVLRRTKIKDKK